MPVNRKYPPRNSSPRVSITRDERRMLTFEYILIAGVNDRLSKRSCWPRSRADFLQR